MKEYIASVTYEGKLEIIEREYTNKKDFYNDLRCNGYRIRFISTPENFDNDCEKYYEACDINKRVKKMIYESDKKFASGMNMSVKEYRKWLHR